MAEIQTARRRAPAMSGDDRRAAIIEATLPLLAEHGTKVTTSQIAQAAGIAEGTVFRVFQDKQALIDQCLQQALDPTEGLAAIKSISRDLTLEVRLRVVAANLTDRMSRIGAVMHALSATGYRMERVHDQKRHADREQWFTDTTDALIELIGPDAEALRLPPERAAQIFLGVVFSSQLAGRMRGCGSPVDQDTAEAAHAMNELIDVFLRGVLNDDDTSRHGETR
ncbi:MAG: TetR/AcrR family transcriptional regulator [Micromonosporaceae bacterium]